MRSSGGLRRTTTNCRRHPKIDIDMDMHIYTYEPRPIDMPSAQLSIAINSSILMRIYMRILCILCARFGFHNMHITAAYQSPNPPTTPSHTTQN